MEDGRASSVDYNDLLAQYAGNYLSSLQLPAGEPQPEALRWLCAVLERVLERELVIAQVGDWVWVDGIVPGFDLCSDAVSVVQPSEVRIHGYAYWGECVNGPFWHDPLRAQIRLDDTGLRYVLEFGNATHGLRSLPGERNPRRADWLSPAEWLYRFTNVRPD